MRLREIDKMHTANQGNRTLLESVMMPEVAAALRDWCRADPGGVLIGGLGLSYHVRPRMTQDIDFLFLSDGHIPEQVPGFKRLRAHAFQHNRTHVEIELVTPELVKVPKQVVDQVVATAITSDGVNVASASGLVALKLFRHSMQDQADIVALIKTGHVSLEGYDLPPKLITAYERLVEIARDDPHP